MFMPSKMPAAVRQTSSAAFAGVVCKNATNDFEAHTNAKNVIEYVDPDDLADNAATQGGLFRFETTVLLREIRGACGDISVAIADADGTHSVAIGVATANRIDYSNGIVVQASQTLKISSTTAGWVEAYVVKADWI